MMKEKRGDVKEERKEEEGVRSLARARVRGRTLRFGDANRAGTDRLVV